MAEMTPPVPNTGNKTVNWLLVTVLSLAVVGVTAFAISYSWKKGQQKA
jgi:hypothetical protein